MFLRLFNVLRHKLTNMEALIKKNQEAALLIEQLKTEIEILKKSGVDVSKCESESNAILQENKALADQIAAAKAELIKAELVNGVVQVVVPEVVKTKNVEPVKEEVKKVGKVIKVSEVPKQNQSAPKVESERPAKTQAKPVENNETVDVSRFDMRIGKILEVSKHPEADSLYIEKVDVGEDKPRQIISGLVKYCTEADLQDRLAVFLLNLKPAKMRGVMSEGMIMCASAPEQGVVEPLNVPAGVKPGDRVTVEGYEGTPDSVMNPKKKILETVKPELKVNADGVATYRGARWQVNGQVGSICSTKLKDVQIA